jgi:divalent metal cation (Fe/Co/Zn/Cd) transporter
MPKLYTKGMKAGQQITVIGVVANALLIILKFCAGIVGHSQALIADAIHSISDFFTDAVRPTPITISATREYKRRHPESSA